MANPYNITPTWVYDCESAAERVKVRQLTITKALENGSLPSVVKHSNDKDDGKKLILGSDLIAWMEKREAKVQ